MVEFATSFRDPSGCCILLDDKALRFVEIEGVPALRTFLASACARRLVTEKKMVPTVALGPKLVEQWLPEDHGFHQRFASAPGEFFEHEKIAFPSYPYEWPPEMLAAAGQLTLELAEATLAEGYGLKDATPYNVLFRGPEPVFIDVLSFEGRAAGDPVWRPYAQFVRTFLLPLLAHQRWGLRLADTFLTHRDGLEPEEVYRMCRPLQRLLPPYLSLVSMPTWLGRGGPKPSVYREHKLGNPEQARFILESLFHRLRRRLHALKPATAAVSTWSDYMATHHYTEAAFAAKREFVEVVLREFQAQRVLDVGANTGFFSALAAKAGADVVAIDYDAACVGAIWRNAQKEKLRILPLVVDLARPSPAVGWRNRECPAFLQRAKGAFDGMLMLAVLHHLLVTERIPLPEVLALAAELTTRWLVIEFVAPQDSMFQCLTRGREHLFTGLNRSVFEAACQPCFEVVRTLRVPETHRWLYLLRKKGGSA